MASSGNFGNNNILIKPVATTTHTHGNREITSSSGSWNAPLTMAANSGKWYIEYYVNSGSSGRNVGVAPTQSIKYNQGDYNFGVAGDYVVHLNSGGSIYNNSDTSATQTGISALATGDIMAVAMNLDASPKTVQFYKNGTTVGTAENINTSAVGPFAPLMFGHNATTMTVNAGQDSSFAGAKSTGTANAADGNGFGNFYYTPPSGFNAFCTANLPVDENIDPAETDDNISSKQVGAVTYTGNGTSVDVTGFGFKPDLIWIKMRSPHTYNNLIFDTTRGVHKHLSSDRAATEFSTNQTITAFGTDGFTYGTELSGNDSGDSHMAWGWRANGGTTSTNTDGTVTSTVQANQAAGFSIVTFTGINSATTATVGHGLGKAPKAIMHFCRTSAVYPFFRGFDGAFGSESTVRNTNPNGSPTDVSSSGGALTAPTSTTFNINNYTGIGGGGFDYVAYCWAPIEGFSKFGSYTGNGNADGPFVYTGFRPKIVVIIGKNYGVENFVLDSTRNPSNPVDNYLRWGRTSTESENSSSTILDFQANGFKLKASGADYNGNNTVMTYMAWGDAPFKYNKTF